MQRVLHLRRVISCQYFPIVPCTLRPMVRFLNLLRNSGDVTSLLLSTIARGTSTRCTVTSMKIDIAELVIWTLVTLLNYEESVSERLRCKG
jgi:hypothetical protein